MLQKQNIYGNLELFCPTLLSHAYSISCNGGLTITLKKTNTLIFGSYNKVQILAITFLSILHKLHNIIIRDALTLYSKFLSCLFSFILLHFQQCFCSVIFEVTCEACFADIRMLFMVYSKIYNFCSLKYTLLRYPFLLIRPYILYDYALLFL